MSIHHHAAPRRPPPATLPHWAKVGANLSLLCLSLLSLVLLRWALRSPQTFDGVFARLY